MTHRGNGSKPGKGIAEYGNLEAAIRHRSLTVPFAFVVRHECKIPYQDTDGETKYRNNMYFAFNDAAEFLKMQDDFPYSHEVIYPRYEDKAQGRLIFDFDLEEKYAGEEFVKESFVMDIEWCILETFRCFYSEDIDPERFVFVWLYTPYTDKYSRHLIVKHAFFCNDWVDQLKTFYSLFKIVAARSRRFSYIPEKNLLDAGIANTNRTFRICGCKKIGKKRMLMDGQYSIYDTFVQLHRQEDAKEEQCITENHLCIDKVMKIRPRNENELIATRYIPAIRRVLAPKQDLVSIEGVLEEVKDIIAPLTDLYNIRSTRGGMLTLDRRCSGPCPISGAHHDSENAYVIVRNDGEVRFYCFRGCTDVVGSKHATLGSVMDLPDEAREERVVVIRKAREEEADEEAEKQARLISFRAKTITKRITKRTLTTQAIAGQKKRQENSVRDAKTRLNISYVMDPILI